jgi:hypothetical protein
MKTKLSLATLAFLLFTVNSFAQYSTFDISTYKLPDIKTRRLDFTFDLDQSLNSMKSIYNTTQKSNAASASGSLNVVYYQFRNKENYQGEQTGVFNIQPSFIKSNDNGSRLKDNSFNAEVHFSSTNRFFNLSNKFIEVDPVLSYSFDDRYYSYFLNLNKDYNTTFSANVPISVGFGRIEPVEDARLAVYILDELAKQNRISEQPSDAKILELAAEISKIKKKRFFDSRIKRMEELQTIDSFLVANKIVSSGDIVYFTHLADQWSYASGPARNSGFSVNLGLNDEYGFSNYVFNDKFNGYIENDSKVKTNTYIIGTFANLKYSRPHNLFLQSDIRMGLYYDYRMYRYPQNSGNNTNSNIIGTMFQYYFSYIPDSRTTVTVHVNATEYYSFNKRKIQTGLNQYLEGDEHQNTIGPSAGADIYYYLSPQLRLQADWGFSYSSHNYRADFGNPLFDTSNKNTQLTHSLSLTLTYSLF